MGLKVSLSRHETRPNDNSTVNVEDPNAPIEVYTLLDEIISEGRLDMYYVYTGKSLAWFTAVGWLLFAGIEYYESLSYLSESEYDMFIEEYS